MSKYTIKNCGCNPACDECYIRCKDITDCVMKQIVDECRNELEKRDAYSVSIYYDFAKKILKFVESEEVDV